MHRKTALLDSNILVFAHSPTDRHFDRARTIVEAGVFGRHPYAIAEQNLLEWYSAITSRRVNSSPLEPSLALESIRDYKGSALMIVRPTADTVHHFEIILRQSPPVRGKDIFDRYLAATALSNGIDTILTENVKDFAGIPGLTTVNPFEES